MSLKATIFFAHVVVGIQAPLLELEVIGLRPRREGEKT
jgi:hypothetical protein